MSGPDLQCLVPAYARAMRCPVLTYAYGLLPGGGHNLNGSVSYAMSGTDIACGATAYAMCGTDLAYRGTRSYRSILVGPSRQKSFH
eukprot:2209205-Rhodomonas_salina.1